MNANDLNNYQNSCELKLTDGVYDYYVLGANTAAHTDSRTIRYTNERDAEKLIEASIQCTGDTSKLQSFLSKHHRASAWSSNDKKLLKQAATLLMDREIVVQPRSTSESAHGAFAQEDRRQKSPKNYSIGTSLPDFGNATITYKIVEDQPGDFIPGVLLAVTLTDGRFKELVSAYDGKVIIDNTKGGTSGFNLDVSNIPGATLENTFAYVGVNSKPIEPKEEAQSNAKRSHGRLEPKTRQHLKYIANITEHKVSKGETLASIAQSNNSTFKDLAYFNWGTYEIEKIVKFMARDIGAINQTPGARDVVFTGNESPGIVYVPAPLSVSDLRTDREHTIRVKRTGYRLTYLYKIDLDNPEIKNDTVTLISDDNTWEYTLCIKELEEVEEDWILMVFPAPPKGKTYSLIHTPGEGNESSYIFHSTAYDLVQFDEKASLDGGLFG